MLASDDDNGRIAIELLRKAMKSKSICFAIEKLFDQEMPTEKMKNILLDLKNVQNRSEVVIIWASNFDFIKTIVKKSAEIGLDNLIWIVMTETWQNIIRYRPELGQNIIMLTIDNIEVHDFIHHKNQITYESPIGNKWVGEFFISLKYCPKNSSRIDCINLVPSGTNFGHRFSENVIASVYVFAHGLHQILGCNKTFCSRKKGDIDYGKLKNVILKPENEVKIPFSDFTVRFQSNGDISAHMYHFLLYTNNGIVNFGNWSNGKQNSLEIDQNLFWNVYSQSNKGRTSKVRTTCSLTCQPGSYRVNQTTPCCWSCIECPYNEVSFKNDSKGCQKCGDLEAPNGHKNRCIPLDNSKFTFNNFFGLCIGVVSVFGMLYLLFVMLVYGVLWETPGVKSTNREMSMIQVLCLFLLLFLPVLYSFEIKEMCIARLVMFGSLHSLVLTFVLLKTYRLWRLFQPHLFNKHIRLFLSLSTQVSISFVTFLLQLVVFATWYSFHKPSMNLYTNFAENRFINHCGDFDDYLLYAIVVYILLLALASGFIAFRARSLPENFNEAQFIWLAMFTYFIVWISFFPLHLSLNKLHQPTVLLSVNLASTLVLGVTLYGNKIRMLIFFPHLNTKLHFTGLSDNASVRTFSSRFSRKETNAKSKKARQKNRVISFSFEKTI